MCIYTGLVCKFVIVFGSAMLESREEWGQPAWKGSGAG